MAPLLRSCTASKTRPPGFRTRLISASTFAASFQSCAAFYGKHAVEFRVRERQLRGHAQVQFDAAGPDCSAISPRGLAQHDVRMIRTGDESRHAAGARNIGPRSESDLEDAILRVQAVALLSG